MSFSLAAGDAAQVGATFDRVREAIRARIETWLAAGAPFGEGPSEQGAG